MSSAISQVFELPGKLLDSVFGGSDSAPAPAPAPAPAAPAAEIAAPVAAAPVSAAAADLTPTPGSAEDVVAPAAKNSVATRTQQVTQRAAAAGALRSDNEADILGTGGVKRRSASRTLLG